MHGLPNLNMLQMFEEDPELVILTSDEAHFNLNEV